MELEDPASIWYEVCVISRSRSVGWAYIQAFMSDDTEFEGLDEPLL